VFVADVPGQAPPKNVRHAPGPKKYVMSVAESVTGVVTVYQIRHSSPSFPAKPVGAPSDHAS
jgi:hypothetical protein